ncbi:DUF2325 domain-containing protein [Massilia forsythiae]|uniref:DUF2325 domain-containing protein n=1 Tax=Massilia forsythiae TaxID=2728020 RepID=A0A7Z2VXN3_9BURK|nr:DUF2325 domain-containing protein [Massilia forsythiae]QJE00785.1 DUF2325 domain-containing protein [Massilia forsythiae]
MQVSAHDFEQLLREHRVLLDAYRDVQARCGERLLAQARAIARLEAQTMRLRAQAIRRQTELAWEREDRAERERAIPDLSKRVALARQVTLLQARIHQLMRAPGAAHAPARTAVVPWPRVSAGAEAPDTLETSLAAADLVICQTGCMSHGAYWRVQDHCQRTGKTCVLVERPDALRVVRIHGAIEDGAPACVTAPHTV